MHWIEAFIIERLADPAFNRISPDLSDEGEPAFAEPLVGFARGDDPLWDFLKQDIGPFLWTPAEAYALAFPHDPAEPSDLTVISWILPQTAATRADHRKSSGMPSLRWSKVRLHGERINERLRAEVVRELISRHHPACAPSLLPEWSRMESPKYGFASLWSERHAAHVAGLGTFGLSDGLITPRGKAVRVGSVVARIDIPATIRPYTRHNEWCLHAATGKCGVCIRRCPAGAISEAGHDKVACHAYIRRTTELFVEREQLGERVSSCGLCQASVPCEAAIPKAALRRRPT
ncbi:4Fe-4S ferredoxin [Desulfocurvibacter africanus]|uniref:4Fe-4S ferredoxin, iron-sulfur binding protein n=1 Tax=Desulfocurvibacter africanus subsp. africanus str. Walvis Bay TaxID=690850 RepID=F3YTT5_DESAF|nr:4Fe-4S ferredoxin [Desulfocurvibacter africanus]EGJ48466.1 4Fe-4S ferredoxin, iron-sulfur binding protein [Desulfocurvibacter africanus subsp. africanus str. Walvis Bay]